MKVKLFLCIMFTCVFGLAYATPTLESYLQNDLELKKLSLELKKSLISSEKTKIQNGFDVTLSTGTARFTFSDDTSNVSLEPSIDVEFPQLSNLTVSASSQISITGEQNNSSDTSVSLGIDLISSSMLNRKIELKQAERAILEAQRDFQDRLLEAEKEFYSELRSLFSLASDIASLKKDLYDDSLSFESIKAKGYEKASSKYRQAEMTVLSDEHEIKSKERELLHECAVFASKCGEEFDTSSDWNSFLPQEIPIVEPIDILLFNKDEFTQIESAVYTHELNELQRKADKDFTLKASGGYTLKNSNTSYSGSDSSDKSDTLDAGLTASWQGLSLGAGINLPISSEGDPVYTVSATINPNTFRTKNLTKESYSLTSEQELIQIQIANENYDTSVVDKLTELQDLLWSKETNATTFELWSNLESDERRWFEQGIVTESEYKNAEANKELYRIKQILNQIDFILYNDSVKLLFCRDLEIKSED